MRKRIKLVCILWILPASWIYSPSGVAKTTVWFQEKCPTREPTWWLCFQTFSFLYMRRYVSITIYTLFDMIPPSYGFVECKRVPILRKHLGSQYLQVPIGYVIESYGVLLRRRNVLGGWLCARNLLMILLHSFSGFGKHCLPGYIN